MVAVKDNSKKLTKSILLDKDKNMDMLINMIKDHKDIDSKSKKIEIDVHKIEKMYKQTEHDLQALQLVGQIIGHILKKIKRKKYIVKASSGPRYVVGCKLKLDQTKLKTGTRVSLDMTTLTIMHVLPIEIDPTIFNMISDIDKSENSKNKINYKQIGGLHDQINQLREVVELPILNPYIFDKVGVKTPKGVLLYGPPGTGKTLLAKAMASNVECNFMRIVVSAVVDKYIGESARIIREMFIYAKTHQPCIIFMDEIDAIGGRRFSHGTSADREIQRTLMELLNHLDGFEELGEVKIIMATNRPDVLDPALVRPGRLDRKIEIPLPNDLSRIEILKIHAKKMSKADHINYELVCKLCNGFNGADLRNVCTEAGIYAIRALRDYVNEDDFYKAARKVGEAKKLEGMLDYGHI